MHELSVAISLLDVVAEEAEKLGATRVVSIRLKLGPLSGVVKESLLSAFAIARVESPLPDCMLIVEDVPIVAYCPTCDARRPVVSMQQLACSLCATPVSELISGRDLEIVGLEIVDGPTDTTG